MISTSNYVARKFGVRSAMPGFIAKRLCPHLVFVDCHYDKYKAASLLARQVILEYNAQYLHDFGLDEFYVDITDAVHQRFQSQCPLAIATSSSDDPRPCPPPPIADLRRCAEAVVSEMRRRITERTGGLTCSAGIANNFFLAKIGNGVVVIFYIYVCYIDIYL
jgi:nucleotidyltransferase/DNA polymerase involved in DNA repair